MKAIVIDRYGPADELQVREQPQPEPRGRQVVVENWATSVNPVDWKIRNGSLRMLFGQGFPKILGYDLCGKVLEVGPQVKHFRPGDWVYGRSDHGTGGAYAEVVRANEEALAKKPESLTPALAAAVPLAGLTALQALKDKAGLRPGQKVLVTGASGGVGHLAVQIAKALSAEVTGVCSTDNVNFVLNELKADVVVDYKKQPVLSEDQLYDVILDAAAVLTFKQCRDHLEKDGHYISTLPSAERVWAVAQSLVKTGPKAHLIVVKPRGRDLEMITQLIEEGHVKPHVQKFYSLDEVAEAHRVSETGHVRGKLVLQIRK